VSLEPAPTEPRAIDALVNVANAWMAGREFTRRAKSEVFGAGADWARDVPADELIRVLDENGVDKAIIGVDPEEPADWVCEFTRAYPGRFFLGAEPRIKHGMDALWAMEDLCARYPVVAIRAAPMFVGRPANEAVWYPLYAKAVELDLPVCLTTGIPGPPLLRADLQDPMFLDRPLLDFPALKLVMLHGADPWWAVAFRLLLRHRNLWMATSAWSPKRLPAELLAFMNTRGADKVLFASDFPVLTIERCVREARELDLKPDVLEKYLRGNAEALFFGGRSPRHIAHQEVGT
jgi:predicted TIM-barrel fold metal-dependent hydrolase